jgi:hypothetical protein
MNSRGNNPGPLGRLHAAVAAHIRPVTRFDTADLQETDPERTQALNLELTLLQEVDFSRTERRGAGRLPPGVSAMPDETAYRGDLQRRQERAQAEAPQALQAWAGQAGEASHGRYVRLLPSAAAFLRPPGNVGYEKRCHGCGGAGKVGCAACNGVGDQHCYVCASNRRIACFSCHGNKTSRCAHCGGRGQSTDYVTHSVWDAASNGYRTETRPEQRSCMHCSGRGSNTCHTCEFDGKVTCSQCQGRGRISCAGCLGAGKVSCGPCSATGVLHVSGTVEASVQVHQDLPLLGADAALRSFLQERVPAADLPQLCTLQGIPQHAVDGTRMHSRYRLRLEVCRAGFSAAGTQFMLHGLGPELRVYSFENIAGRLLAADLLALETCVHSRRAGALLDVTADFLRSELNLLIAEHVADADEATFAAVEQRFQGLVDADYCVRATAALRGALGQLYRAQLQGPALLLCGVTALGAAALVALGWPTGLPASDALAALAAATVAWAALEWLTRWRIARRCSAGFALRLNAQLAAGGSVRRWRVGAALAATAAVGLAAWGTMQLPPVREQLALRADIRQTDQQIRQWQLMAEPDLRQRSHPPRAALQARAEAGAGPAQLVLAWHHLLGIGDPAAAAGQASQGGPPGPDPVAAAQWLDRCQAKLGSTALWRAARAVQMVQTPRQAAAPDTLRKVEQELEAAARAGIVEARYWHARLLLDERGPARDPRRGLLMLTAAADGGHAHAALMLGERLGSGQGVKRDLPGARRYLLKAQAAGLGEARAALARLR